MTVLANLTSIAVGSDGEAFTDSNSGWTQNTTNPPYGTNAVLVTSATTPNSAYNTATSGVSGYLLDAVPGSRTQTARVKIKRFGTVGSTSVRVQVRSSAGGDDYIGAQYRFDNWQIKILKSVNGTVSNLMADTSALPTLADGDYGELEIRAVEVGTPGSPSVNISAWWNKNGASLVQIGATQNATDSVFDSVGRVGFAILNASASANAHVTEFYAEDDTGGGFSIAPIAAQHLYKMMG